MAINGYAAKTKVSVVSSQAEIQELLEKHGIERIGIMREKNQASLWFENDGKYYKLNVPVSANCKNPEQEIKRAWRVLTLLVKAQFTAIAEGVTTIERQFYADMVMPDGQILFDHAKEQVEKSLAGRTPLQLSFGDKA
jgi:hypothetical protein